MFTKFNTEDFEKVQVTFVPEGETIKVERFKEGHTPEVKEFDFAVVDFGSIFNQIRGKTIPLNERIIESSDTIELLGVNNPSLQSALKDVTQLANEEGSPYEDDEKRYEYQQALADICAPMVQDIKVKGIDDTLGMLMERGALLIGGYYDFPDDHIARVVAKRLDKKDGTFGLGLSDLRLPEDTTRFRRLHIQEDCIATGDSIGGLVYALKQKEIEFEDVLIDCPVATQSGVEFLTQFFNWLKIPQYRFRIGGMVYGLNEHYYLIRTEEEGYPNQDFYVGDMGEWSKILPKSFNDKAPWNRVRWERGYS